MSPTQYNAMYEAIRAANSFVAFTITQVALREDNTTHRVLTTDMYGEKRKFYAHVEHSSVRLFDADKTLLSVTHSVAHA